MKQNFLLVNIFYCRGGQVSKFLEMFSVKKSCLLELNWLCFKILSGRDEFPKKKKKHSKTPAVNKTTNDLQLKKWRNLTNLLSNWNCWGITFFVLVKVNVHKYNTDLDLLKRMSAACCCMGIMYSGQLGSLKGFDSGCPFCNLTLKHENIFIFYSELNHLFRS